MLRKVNSRLEVQLEEHTGSPAGGGGVDNKNKNKKLPKTGKWMVIMVVKSH